MEFPYKLGKLEARIPVGIATLRHYVPELPAAPDAADYYSHVTDWGMCLNDRIGDCTLAGVDHLLKAWNREVNVNDPTPSDEQIGQIYFSLTGGQDTGLVEYNVLETWRTKGLFGSKIAAYAPVDFSDETNLRDAVAFYGGSYLGVKLPLSAQQQFQAGEPWSVVAGSPIEGGHCIVAVGYDANYVYIVSWGKVVPVTYAWLAAYLEEAWAIIPDEFVKTNSGPIVDLATLRADLDAVSA